MEVDNPPKAPQRKKLNHSKLRKRMHPLSNLTPIAPPDASQAPVNPLKQPILELRAQLNFYFGDSNLSKDKFLR